MASHRRRIAICAAVLSWLVVLPALSGVFVTNQTAPAKDFAIAAPTIDSPPDLTFENGSLGETIVWHPSDASPKNYTITRNGTVYEEESWAGEDIVVFLNHLYFEDFLDEPSEIPAHFVFECTVFDQNEESVSDTVLVNVIPDESAPIIDQPDDIEYEEGSFGHEIEWNIQESNPDFYNVTRLSSDPSSNNTVIEAGDWQFINISISVDGLNATHWYFYTLFVNDTLGRNSTSSVNVTVVPDLTAPTVTGPGNISFEFGESGHEITWQVFDSNPENYSINVVILYNNTEYGDVSDPLIHSPQNVTKANWSLVNPLGDNVTYSLDDVFLGNYSFTIMLLDIFGRNSTHSLNVTIFEDVRAPIISSPDSVLYEEGYTGHTLEWSAEENNPLSYNLTRNGELLLNGAWAGANITVNVDDLSVGTHDYRVAFTDFFNQSSSSVVVVTVQADSQDPVVDQVQVIQSYSTPVANNITIQAFAWDLNGIGNITVEWYIADESDIDVMDMSPQGNDMYESRLGRFDHNVVIHYRVTAKDNSSVQNESVTEWSEFVVTPQAREGLPLALFAAVMVFGALSTLVVVALYFRTRTR
ncbi:MAG: hypothetical protein ACFFD9_08855 [Candidatus Thorarchaeota archaeon]